MIFKAAGGKTWFQRPSNNQVRRSRANILKTDPNGNVPVSARKNTPLEVWHLFFPEDVLNEFILKPTNEHRRNREIACNADIADQLISHGSSGIAFVLNSVKLCFILNINR